MHIVQLVESGNPRMFGGVIGSCMTRAKFLIENGHKVSLVCRGYPGWETPFEKDGVDVYPIRPKDYKLGKFFEKQYLHPLMPWSMAKAVDRIAFEEGIDLLEINDSFPAQRLGKVVAKHGFWTAHSIQGTAFLHPGLPPKIKLESMKWEEKVSRMCDLSFPLSGYLATAFKPFVEQDRVRIVYNPIPEAFRNVFHPSPALNSDQPLQLLFLSRIDSGKRLSSLIRAVAKLPDPDRVRVRVVGQGEELAASRRLVHELGLRRFFEFTGDYAYGTDAVLAEYFAADAVVIPTAMEGFSLAILECMGTRTPLFCSNLEPNIEALGADYPLLFGVDDVAGLAAQISRVVDNRQLLVSSADALTRRSPLFTPESCFAPMLEALDELEHGQVKRRVLRAA